MGSNIQKSLLVNITTTNGEEQLKSVPLPRKKERGTSRQITISTPSKRCVCTSLSILTLSVIKTEEVPLNATESKWGCHYIAKYNNITVYIEQRSCSVWKVDFVGNILLLRFRHFLRLLSIHEMAFFHTHSQSFSHSHNNFISIELIRYFSTLLSSPI